MSYEKPAYGHVEHGTRSYLTCERWMRQRDGSNSVRIEVIAELVQAYHINNLLTQLNANKTLIPSEGAA